MDKPHLRKILTVTGLLLIVLGFLALLAGAFERQGSSMAGVIFIGFIPIAFGYGDKGPLLLLLAILMAVAMTAFFALSRRRAVRST
jgi:uncharacterized membrane protein